MGQFCSRNYKLYILITRTKNLHSLRTLVKVWTWFVWTLTERNNFNNVTVLFVDEKWKGKWERGDAEMRGWTLIAGLFHQPYHAADPSVMFWSIISDFYKSYQRSALSLTSGSGSTLPLFRDQPKKIVSNIYFLFKRWISLCWIC